MGSSELRKFDVALPGWQGKKQRTLRVELAKRFNVPRRLQQSGLSDYEPFTLATVLAALDQTSEPAFLDVGANVGVFSWLVAGVTGRPCVAFEPVPALRAAAQKVIEANGLSVRCEASAMSKAPGRAKFYISAKSDCSNSLRAGFRRADEEIEVELDTLDRYVPANDLRPGVIKIDTESTEPDVLQGAETVLAQLRPWVICEVLAGRTEEALMEVMRPHGYAFYQINDQDVLTRSDRIVGDDSYRFVNWLFAPVPLDSDFHAARERHLERLMRCAPEPGMRRLLSRGLDFNSSEGASVWRASRVADTNVQFSRGGFTAICQLPTGERFFVHNGAEEPRFDHKPPPESVVEIPGGTTELEAQVSLSREGEMPIQMWLQLYGPNGVDEARCRLRDGLNRLRARVPPGAGAARVVFRISGAGRAEISSLRAYAVGG